MDESTEEINRTPSNKKRRIEGDAAGGKAKLTNSQKMEILKLLELGESQASIAKKYQVSAVTISKINKAKSILIERIPLSNPNSTRISSSLINTKNKRDVDVSLSEISFEADNNEESEVETSDEDKNHESNENKVIEEENHHNNNKKYQEDTKKLEEMTMKMKEIYNFMVDYDQILANDIETIFMTMKTKYFPEKKV